MPTLADLKADIQAYTQYDDTDFIAEIPAFIRASEERIWYVVQLPNFRTVSTGALVAGTATFDLPEDFLAPASFAIKLTSGAYVYLLNKDVNYLREVFPNPTVQGTPSHYAILDADADKTQVMVAKTPDAAYVTEFRYFYRPASLTDGAEDGATWLSTHAYNTLLYGALDEAATYMKRNAGIDNMGDTYGQRFLMGLQGLKNLGEARDRKDVYRSGEKRVAE